MTGFERLTECLRRSIVQVLNGGTGVIWTRL